MRPAADGRAPTTAAAAEQQALELVRKNADLMGFTLEELKSAKVATKGGLPGTMQAWAVNLSGLVPRIGYEAFPTVAKRIRIEVTFGNGGTMTLSGSGGILPPFTLCTTAPLAPGSPAVVEAIIGREIGYSDFGGRRIPAGTITAQDIGAVEKTIFVEYSDAAHAVMLTLAYKVTLHKVDLTWTAFVDASSGWLLALRPNFVS
jgi:hypothetical protein